MRVGIDASSLVRPPTGVGRYVFEMSRHLARLGHDLVLYMPAPPVVGLGELSASFRIGGWAGSILPSMWSQTLLPRLTRADGLDVFWGPSHRLPAILDNCLPRVLTIHDLVWVNAAATMRWRTWLAERALMGGAIRAADLVVVDSHSTASALRDHFPRAQAAVETIHPGRTLTEVIPDPDALDAFGVDKPYALFVGTLEPRKNLSNLLAAWASLPAALRNRRLLVIAGGQGWGSDDVRKLCARQGIVESVRLTGYVTDRQLARLYADARFVAMPSIYEGFGLPIVEANGFGVPVLTSDCSSMPEVGGAAALLVDPQDVSSIAAGIQRLFEDNVQHAELAAHARANAARFDWAESADRLVSVFERAKRSRQGCDRARPSFF
jgi:glycosyltransferase involved in cell wall biosynthesis